MDGLLPKHFLNSLILIVLCSFAMTQQLTFY